MRQKSKISSSQPPLLKAAATVKRNRYHLEITMMMMILIVLKGQFPQIRPMILSKRLSSNKFYKSMNRSVQTMEALIANLLSNNLLKNSSQVLTISLLKLLHSITNSPIKMISMAIQNLITKNTKWHQTTYRKKQLSKSRKRRFRALMTI